MPLTYRRILLSAVLGVLVAAPMVRAQNEGVEPLARGPVHEAYANPVEGQPSASPVLDKEPPAPIEEVPADQKPAGDNVQWLPGYFAWDDGRNDFLWVSGFWRIPPPGRTWVPGSWRQVAGGWQWTHGFWASAETGGELAYLPPPPAPVEAGPSVPAPADGYIYTPGSYVYVSNHYAWRPGVWILHRPGWVWIPAHYRWTPVGYVFIDGYWDYPLADRGLLFAPVWIDVRYAYRPRWYFTPTIAIYDEAMFGSLFVRGGVYYQGDYFDARFTTLGYRSWFSVSFGRTYAYDPLFSYYSFTYRRDRYWGPAIREVYVGRYAGDIPRPSVTVVNNVTNVNIINNPTIVNKYTNINKSTNITNITTVNNSVVNLKTVNNTTNNANVNMAKFTKLQPVSAAQKVQFVKTTQQIQDVGKQRLATENHLVAQGGSIKANDPPKMVKFDMPKAAVSVSGNAAGNVKGPPPPPVVHKPTLPAGTTTIIGNHPPMGGTGTGTATGTGGKPPMGGTGTSTGTGTGAGTGTGGKPPMGGTGTGSGKPPTGSPPPPPPGGNNPKPPPPPPPGGKDKDKDGKPSKNPGGSQLSGRN